MNNNKCWFVGNLGKDAETKVFENNQRVTLFSIAVDNGYFDKNGNTWVQKVVWLNIVCWRKLAEKTMGLKKGQRVGIWGKATTRTYEAQNGETKLITEYIADEVFVIDSFGNSTKAGDAPYQDDPGPVDDLPF